MPTSRKEEVPRQIGHPYPPHIIRCEGASPPPKTKQKKLHPLWVYAPHRGTQIRQPVGKQDHERIRVLELVIIFLFLFTCLIDIRLLTLLLAGLLFPGRFGRQGRWRLCILHLMALGAKLLVELGNDVQEGLVLLQVERDAL